MVMSVVVFITFMVVAVVVMGMTVRSMHRSVRMGWCAAVGVRVFFVHAMIGKLKVT